MTRVVLDTNVFVSSYFGGNPRKVIDRWKTGTLTLCLSPAIIEEYTAVLSRLGLKNHPELKELLTLFAKGYQCLFIAKTPNLNIVPEDPADNKFFECAVALDAQWIISGDKKVLQVKDYMGIRTVSPKEFLQETA